MTEKQTTATRADWGVIAALHELLAFSFRYPSRELADAVISGEWADAACEVFRAAGCDVSQVSFELAPAGIDGLPIGDPELLLRALRAEATRLFVGAPEPAVYPYEGAWRAQDDGVQPLLFVSPSSLEVERFCHECGLARPEGTNEPLDHVSTELELLQYLASIAGGLVDLPEQGPLSTDLPGGSAVDTFELFLEHHARVWIPRFAERVALESRLPFYRIAAQLLLMTL